MIGCGIIYVAPGQAHFHTREDACAFLPRHDRRQAAKMKKKASCRNKEIKKTNTKEVID
jgi:hypothetical protein